MIIEALLLALGLPSAAAGGYLGLLGLAARPRRGDTAVPPTVSLPSLAFVVPAHDEATGIQRTVRSLLGVDYPAGRFCVVVVADNCADETASLAREAGARVLERTDPNLRGKGYALEFAFHQLMTEGQLDGFVVVDADTVVSSNLLKAIGRRLADGCSAVQAHYGVRNADDSWRTRLMDFAFTLFHGVRSTARERLGLSAGLRGNGMGFAVGMLKAVPYRAYSLAEDVEYAVELGLAGYRVAYAEEAEVFGDMVAGTAGSESQRKRWEQGRKLLLSQYAGRLLSEALHKRSALLLDLAADIIVPPLVTVVTFTALGTVATTAAVATGLCAPAALIPWGIASAGLSIYLVQGLRMSTRGWLTLVDLLHVPRYVLWKLTLKVRGRRGHDETWVRTARTGDL
jgi:1,2-diacylglycerol 3-beta-glucosyltransferase